MQARAFHFLLRYFFFLSSFNFVTMCKVKNTCTVREPGQKKKNLRRRNRPGEFSFLFSRQAPVSFNGKPLYAASSEMPQHLELSS